MRSGKIRIKKYKTGHHKGLILLLLLPAAAAALYFLAGSGKITLPSFTLPSFSKEDMQQETRVITLEGGKAFALQLGAFSEKSGADALAKSFISRGAAGYVHQQEGYRVLAAAYHTREEAAAVQNRLSDQHGVDVYIYPLARSTVTLRLTGRKAQLDALSDAWDMLLQLSSTLAHLSQSLDEGSMETEEIMQALSSQKETVQALQSRMLSLFPKEEHTAVTALSGLMNSLHTHLSGTLAAENATRLGSRIKYCQLFVLCETERYVNSLIP